MSRSTDDAFRDLSGSLLGLMALADRTLAEGSAGAVEAGMLAAARRMARRMIAEVPCARMPRPSALMGTIEGFLTGESALLTRLAYRPGPPVVEPSPIHPGELAPAVLNVPAHEIEEFLNVVVRRYLRQLRKAWLGATTEAWLTRGLAPVDDTAFADILYRTAMSRFLNPALDPPDRRAFARVLARLAPGTPVFKADFTAVSTLDTLEGIHVAASCTLFARHPTVDRLVPLAIRIRDRVFEPDGGAAWDLAKYFALQGAGLSLVMGSHPTVHFPMDAVNAVTKAELSPRHVLSRLLAPHLFMQLPLNYAVLYVNRSVAHNDQREIYTPFPGTKEGFFRLTRAFYRGIPGNSSYPAYRYPLEAPSIPSEYGRFLAGYWRVIESFVSRVVRTVKPGDATVSRWANEIARHVPGFPDARRIADPGVLSAALATFICNVSVVHSADHASYAAIPLNVMPLRMRVPPPRAPGGAPLDRARLVHFEDLFRHHMALEMYFRHHPVRRLVDANYALGSGALGRAVADFKAALALYDERLPKRFIPVEEIASSIQF